ncbi:MAG TPA: hypothetical protein VFG43_06890 [Geminicoccaceae bacterium]|nr:hypothetical protein [Geminicoccaceae bacterium]
MRHLLAVGGIVLGLALAPAASALHHTSTPGFSGPNGGNAANPGAAGRDNPRSDASPVSAPAGRNNPGRDGASTPTGDPRGTGPTK